MNTRTPKIEENKSRSVANSVTQKKSNGRPGFVDNRSYIVFQQKQLISAVGNVVQRNPRVTLGKQLMNNIFSSQNPFARVVFKGMNSAMWLEGQPLQQAHYKVIEQSLLYSNNGILETLIAENKYVMGTEGYTPIYLMGKNLVHRPLQWYLENKK